MANNNLRTLLYRLCLITIGNRHFAECLRHSAKPEIHSQRHCRVPHSAKGTRQKNNRQRSLCRVLFVRHRKSTRQRFTLGKMKIRKNPKIIAKFFFRGRPPPANARPSSATGHRSRCIFCAKFAANVAGGIQTHDLSLVCLLLYHCTTPSLVSRFRYLSSYIILNRE